MPRQYLEMQERLPAAVGTLSTPLSPLLVDSTDLVHEAAELPAGTTRGTCTPNAAHCYTTLVSCARSSRSSFLTFPTFAFRNSERSEDPSPTEEPFASTQAAVSHMEHENKRRRVVEVYRYSPLPNATLIRILDVDFNGRCLLDANLPILSFEFVDLNDKPQFDALSYTWGRPRTVYESKEQFEEKVSAGHGCNIYVGPDESMIQVTQNLYDFLCHLKKMHLNPKTPLVEVPKRSHGPHLPTKIWIDAICINQDEKEEKSKQVAMMDRIYSSCQIVFVWLGVSDWFSERAIPILASLVDRTEKHLDSVRNLPVDHEDVKKVRGRNFNDPSALAAIYAFLNRSWFSRAWIVQEVALAPEVCVLCEGIIFSFNVWKTGLDNKILHYVHQKLLDDRSGFREATRMLVAQFTERFRAHIESNSQPAVRAFRRSLGKGVEWDDERLRVGGEIMHSDKPAVKIFTAKDIVGVEDMPGRAVLRIWTMRALRTNEWGDYDSSSLLNVLDLGRNAQSTDARDKFYAFLGLLRNSKPVPEEEVAHLPTPDYTKPVVKVFHELARYIMKMGSDLQLLSHVQDQSWTKHTDLPSWVPDWTSRRFPNGIAYTGGPGWSASGDLKTHYWKRQQSPYEKTLKVRGYLVDKIRKISELSQVERQDRVRSKFDFTLPAAVALSTPQRYQWHHN